jgi:hypothetical protein
MVDSRSRRHAWRTRYKKLIAALVAAAGLALAPAAADASSVQHDVDRMMREVPGGKQTGPNTISWSGGRVTADVRARASSSFCFFAVCLYASSNQRGTRVRFGCGEHDVTRWFPPRSLAGVSSWSAHYAGTLSNIPTGAPPGTVGQGISIPSGRRGNVPRWFNDRARSLTVRC